MVSKQACTARRCFVTAFSVIMVNYILYYIGGIGKFEAVAAMAVLTPLAGIYFGRQWVKAKEEKIV